MDTTNTANHQSALFSPTYRAKLEKSIKKQNEIFEEWASSGASDETNLEKACQVVSAHSEVGVYFSETQRNIIIQEILKFETYKLEHLEFLDDRRLATIFVEESAKFYKKQKGVRR